MEYVIDTGIWVEFLRQQRHALRRVAEAIDAGHDLIVPAIVYYEVLRGLAKRNNFAATSAIQSLWSQLNIDWMEPPVWDQAVRLWAWSVAQNQLREDADILVAAVAVARNATIVTNNVKHLSIFGQPTEDWTKP